MTIYRYSENQYPESCPKCNGEDMEIRETDVRPSGMSGVEAIFRYGCIECEFEWFELFDFVKWTTDRDGEPL